VIYIEMNILLFASYVLAKGMRQLAGFFKLEYRYQIKTRIAQTLVLVSLVAPFVLNAFPEGRLPYIQFQVHNPLSESATRLRSMGSKTHPTRSKSEAKLEMDASADSFFHLAFEKLRAVRDAIELRWLVFIGFAGFLFVLVRLGLNVRNLLTVLKESICVRKIGNVAILVSETIAVPFSTRILGNP
jgi:hypothetical protein